MRGAWCTTTLPDALALCEEVQKKKAVHVSTKKGSVEALRLGDLKVLLQLDDEVVGPPQQGLVSLQNQSSDKGLNTNGASTG